MTRLEFALSVLLGAEAAILMFTWLGWRGALLGWQQSAALLRRTAKANEMAQSRVVELSILLEEKRQFAHNMSLDGEDSDADEFSWPPDAAGEDGEEC